MNNVYNRQTHAFVLKASLGLILEHRTNHELIYFHPFQSNTATQHFLDDEPTRIYSTADFRKYMSNLTMNRLRSHAGIRGMDSSWRHKHLVNVTLFLTHLPVLLTEEIGDGVAPHLEVELPDHANFGGREFIDDEAECDAGDDDDDDDDDDELITNGNVNEPTSKPSRKGNVVRTLLETFSYDNKLCVFYAIAHMFANRGRSRTALPPDAHPYKDHNFACVKTKLICGEKPLENATHELFEEFKKAHPILTQNWTGASKHILPKIEEHFKIRICIFQKKPAPDGIEMVTPIYKSTQPLVYPTLLLASNDECTHVQIIANFMSYQDKHVCRFCFKIMEKAFHMTRHEKTCKHSVRTKFHKNPVVHPKMTIFDKLSHNGIKGVPKNPRNIYCVYDFESYLKSLECNDLPTTGGNLKYVQAHNPVSCAIFPAVPKWSGEDDVVLQDLKDLISEEDDAFSENDELLVIDDDDDRTFSSSPDISEDEFHERMKTPLNSMDIDCQSPINERILETDEFQFPAEFSSLSPDHSDCEFREGTPVNPMHIDDERGESPVNERILETDEFQFPDEPSPRTIPQYIKGGVFLRNYFGLDSLIEGFYEVLCEHSNTAYEMKIKEYAPLLDQLDEKIHSKRVYLDSARTEKQVKYRKQLLQSAQSLRDSFDRYLRKLPCVSFNGEYKLPINDK